jgi:dTMP kinase
MAGTTGGSDATRGRLIAFEGGEGCGKSTQAQLLAVSLGAVLTREPGGTPAGERIREVLLDGDVGEIGAPAELLLIAAARAEHVRRLIGPALDAGRWVVTDRFAGSSLAYQGYGRRLPLEAVQAVSGFATGGLEADLNVLLELPEEVAAARRCGRPDRIEAEEPGFHARVVAGFRAIAESDPAHWCVVDSAGTPEEVAARVLAAVRARLGDRPAVIR